MSEIIICPFCGTKNEAARITCRHCQTNFRHQLLRLVALATLFVLVGKLFLVDLVVVETVWRILLFAGFGGLFLFISYFYGSWLGLPDLTE